MKYKYYLQNTSAGFLGNSPVFWRKGGSGYTQWIDEAELFGKDEAQRIARSTKTTHGFVLWRQDKVDACAKRTVDIQDLRKD